MGLCPVDLAICERSACHRDFCELADATQLIVCWECGAVESTAHTSNMCVTCLRVYVPDPATEVL
jgi:hypothetical protein